MRDSLVQQINHLERTRLSGTGRAHNSVQEEILRAAIKIERREISCWWPLDGQFLRSRDFGMEALGDFLCDFALDCEHVLQIAIVLLCPEVGVSARVDQLGVYMEPGSCLAYAAFQDVRHAQRITYLMCVSLAAILHDAGAAND